MPVFVILTREPGEEIRFIHDRMPLILPGDYVEEWIKPEELVEAAMTEIQKKERAQASLQNASKVHSCMKVPLSFYLVNSYSWQTSLTIRISVNATGVRSDRSLAMIPMSI